MRGEPFLYPGAVNALIRNYLDRVREGQTPPARAITDREEEIHKLVAEGHTSQEIADLLVISVKTVERHRANLLNKLGLKDRLELTRYAIRVRPDRTLTHRTRRPSRTALDRSTRYQPDTPRPGAGKPASWSREKVLPNGSRSTRPSTRTGSPIGRRTPTSGFLRPLGGRRPTAGSTSTCRRSPSPASY